MPPATQISRQQMDRKLVNLLVAGSKRVGRLLEEDKIDDAKKLSERINSVCSSLGGKSKALPSTAEISAVYSTAEFMENGSVDCSPLCWSDDEKACVVCPS